MDDATPGVDKGGSKVDEEIELLDPHAPWLDGHLDAKYFAALAGFGNSSSDAVCVDPMVHGGCITVSESVALYPVASIPKTYSVNVEFLTAVLVVFSKVEKHAAMNLSN